ncbi:hypothetical protein DENSPDRAFT_199600 [Dentipellis sp. KUC8613]|nr:hypothetical protein DENSPDRAFT_199600 [Dentipellis sp. KUC8613]
MDGFMSLHPSEWFAVHDEYERRARVASPQYGGGGGPAYVRICVSSSSCGVANGGVSSRDSPPSATTLTLMHTTTAHTPPITITITLTTTTETSTISLTLAMPIQRISLPITLTPSTPPPPLPPTHPSTPQISLKSSTASTESM